MSIASKVIVAGFAIFSMIFGSGNIVFPLIIGKDSLSNFPFATLGWLIATVLIPMTGYFGAMLFDADNKKYLAPLGKYVTAAFMFIIMLMVTPIVSRGINVSFGGIHILSPNVSEVMFNAFYSLITLVLALNPGKIVQIIGLVFTPLKFGGVAIVIVGALYLVSSFSDIVPSDIAPSASFINSFKMGYQTMDLLSAFLVASSIFLYIKNSLSEEKRSEKKEILKFILWVCIIGGMVLSIVYFGLIFVGALYAPQLIGTPDEALFTKIAEVAMGEYASWFVAIVIAACCLATNIVLSSVFSDYIHKDILKEKFNRTVILVLVCGFTFSMSLLGFETICFVLGKILEAIYPAIIIFVVARIIYYYAKNNR